MHELGKLRNALKRGLLAYKINIDQLVVERVEGDKLDMV